MTRQPYVYTMPEGFMDDPGIGVKWKIYAIINGFWLNGKTAYAANKFFAEKLNVSERQIRNGLAQLEVDGYIERVINGRLRTIQPKARVVEAEAGVPLGGSESSAEAEAGVPPIALSISDNIPSRATREEESDEEIKYDAVDDNGIPLEKPRKKKNTPEILAVFDIFEDNHARANWKLQEAQRTAATELLKICPIEELRYRYSVIKKYRGDDFCPKINSPYTMLNKMADMEHFLERL